MRTRRRPGSPTIEVTVDPALNDRLSCRLLRQVDGTSTSSTELTDAPALFCARGGRCVVSDERAIWATRIVRNSIACITARVHSGGVPENYFDVWVAQQYEVLGRICSLRRSSSQR